MAEQNKKSVNFLPAYIRSDRNSKFLSSTIDQLVQTPQLERIDGFVGSKVISNFDPAVDNYVTSASPLRNAYQLEPAAVFRDSVSNITDVVSYDDLINEISVQGGNADNLDRVFRTKFYSYDPLIDWDKLVNYNQYYWLPNGPDSISITTTTNNIIGHPTYTMPNGHAFSNGMKVTFTNSFTSGTTRVSSGTEYIIEGVGNSIRLIDLSLLEVNGSLATIYNETFDNSSFDQYGFDADEKVALIPEYITINRASRDLNAWSRYNRWVHRDVINTTAIISGIDPVYQFSYKAKRPIVEFKADIQLYKFGKNGIQNIDLIDDSTTDIDIIAGALGYYIDGELLQQGHRIVLNNVDDLTIRNKIYKVGFTTGTSTIYLTETVDSGVNDLDSLSVNYGTNYSGKSFYYSEDDNKWLYAQQHESLNEFPLFDLFSDDGISYTKNVNENNFSGNKVFGYELGSGIADKVLGFPVKQDQNSIGIGSYLFKNYFSTDSFSIVIDKVKQTQLVSTAFLKINNVDNDTYSLTNVWRSTEDYQIPILETQVIGISTSTVTALSLDAPLTNTVTSYLSFVNSKIIHTSATITANSLSVSFDNTLTENDVVLLKINTDQIPNSNGYYEPPLSLTNNPLNGPIASLTLSQLTDHVASMVYRSFNNDFVGEFPGSSNLRDLYDYAKYGMQLITNENPISFAHIFLGKKEHNVIDALRFAAEQYNQFKLNFLRTLGTITDQIDVVSIVDTILLEIGQNNTPKESFFRSDMVGYGPAKTIREITVTNSYISEYPIGVEFDLSKLSFKSVLIYVNDIQLISGQDYEFILANGSVHFLITLSVGTVIKIHYYESTLSGYIPSTPTKLGLYPKFVPGLITDDRYADGSQLMIQGHDGSLTKSYGDYRDNVILEFEKRIFNNIKIEYNRTLYDMMSVIPGAFRESDYTIDQTNDRLIHDYTKWASVYNVDIFTNNTYDSGTYRTWNYTNTVDTLLGKPAFGTWRAVFKYFYDTDRPHTHPWEMLGFTIKPSWWNSKYGAGPYTSLNTQLWTDLENGYIAGGEYQGTWDKYKRPGLSNIIPVDSSGVLRDLNSFLITGAGPSTQKEDWIFGDYSPAEVAWRNSSYWPFALNVAAALLYPGNYSSKLFDVSRTTINAVGQVVYKEDKLYLDPRKLLIDGINGAQTSGFGNFVIERGRKNYQDYPIKLSQDLIYLDLNLFHKLGGFTSKEKLQVRINAVDPQSTKPGVILPPEDYSLILNISNPIKSARISGVIVQKVDGNFVLKGYDRNYPFFNIYQPINSAIDGAIVVGGKQEHYDLWQPATSDGNSGLSAIDITTAGTYSIKFYKQGQIVLHNGRYYRVKTSHNAQTVFDLNLFQQLPRLPTTGGARVQTSNRFETVVTKVVYGSVFGTIQEVYDVLIGYGAWLEDQGFIFDQYNPDLAEMMDWKFSGKEFLYWSTQKWAEGNLITLSPFADYLKYKFKDSVVDNLFAKNYEYSLQKADGKGFPTDNFDIAREDSGCVIQTKDTQEGIFFAVLNSVQKEHGMVFNNTTIFNDTIYDPDSGYRQKRIRLYGFRTKGWNGDLTSPGFVYDNVEITEWQSYKSYIPGKVVRYNGVYYEANQQIISDETFDFTKWDILASKPIPQFVPNFDYKISQFDDFYSLDIDNFDYSQQKLAQHLIGYTPRNYLNKIFTDPIAQYKFYQGFIREKGTKKPLAKILKASQNRDQGSIEINEEWAIRVGNYGGFETYNEIEFTLQEGLYLENPYVIKFVDKAPSDPLALIHYTSSSNLLITPANYIATSTFVTIDGTFNDHNLELTTAGYVRTDDVTATAYNKNSLLDIANNSILQNGDTIWLGFLENGDWDVYRYTHQRAKIAGVYVSSPGSEITFVTNVHHNLQIGDIVSVVRFNAQVDGVHIVTAIPEVGQFTVASTLAGIVNEPLLAYGSLYRFESARHSDFAALATATDLFNLPENSKVWIDRDTDQKWAVYEKIKNYNTGTVYSSIPTPFGQHMGSSIVADKDSTTVLVSLPGYKSATSINYGKISVYSKSINETLVKKFDYALNTGGKNYCQPNTSTDFGYSLALDNAKDLFFVGAPIASAIRATTATATLVLSTGTGVIRPSYKEGLVKISSRNDRDTAEVTSAVLAQRYSTSTNANSRFGHSLYVNKVAASTSTLLLVGAPGSSAYAGTGTVYAYNINKFGTTVTVTNHPIGTTVNSTSTVSLNRGSLWGYAISGSDTGDIIAISAPKFYSSGSAGIVQIFDKNLHWKQNLYSPFDVNDQFGHAVEVSSSGEFIFVSSVRSQSYIGTIGKVAVYTVNSSGTYVLSQILSNPLENTNLKFGSAISISQDNQNLIISSLGTNRSRILKFYQNASKKLGETTFDNNETRFLSSVPDSGAVYVYNNFDNVFVQADELLPDEILEGSRYGLALASTDNNIFVGAPFNDITQSAQDKSRVYQFKKKDSTKNSWYRLRNQEALVDVKPFQRVALIDTFNEEVLDYLDIVDPLKNKVVGTAEQELKYKLAADPAIYSVGLAATNNDTETNWLDEHVGELWWDLSTAKYIWYEQGNDTFRKNNWGKLFPGASIDIYEWVKSDLLPSEWAARADTTRGLIKGISGQPKYPDNTVISVKQVFNTVTGSFENVYYFWVKNKTTVPGLVNRRLSSLQVANLIADPLANGLKFVEVLSANSIAFANVQASLVGDRISANIAFDTIDNQIPRHTEWMLMQEGSSHSMPNELLDKKLIDSLLGRDLYGRSVPALELTFRNRYGLGIRPQQTLFKDRIEALRNLIDFSNYVLKNNQITNNYNFDKLNSYESIPDEMQREYDQIIDDIEQLDTINTTAYRQGQLTCIVRNGKIYSVSIIDSGYGYLLPPKVSVASSIDAEILTTIDNQGQIISVRVQNAGGGFVQAPILTVRPQAVVVASNTNAGGRWTLHTFNYRQNLWDKIRTQLYNTPLFWDYINWTADEYDQYKSIKYIIDNVYELNLITDPQPGDYIKIKNIGDNRSAILERIDQQLGNFTDYYNIVFSENGTIQIKNSIWDYSNVNYSYDSAPLDEALFDQVPDLELYYILNALKDDLFVNDLKANWNLFFFKAVRYALTEQKLLDWAFKTSFISVKNTTDILSQPVAYSLDASQYYEEFIKEIKPYHSQIREFVATYSNLENTRINTTDFDLPPYYDAEIEDFNVVELQVNSINTATLTSTPLDQYPWKSWADNYTYTLDSILVADSGSGYTEDPTVNITGGSPDVNATAKAYIRNGGVYRIVVTYPGVNFRALPQITIAGGGLYVTRNATASAVLSNPVVRKNIVGIKFDRYSVDSEIGNIEVTETFTCDGKTAEFELEWMADPDKLKIFPTLDKKLVLSANYKIVQFSKNEDAEKFNKYSKFVFLDTLPKENQIFKITYSKNISLFNAVDRIDAYYNPSSTMPGKYYPLLMTGFEYPGTAIQGLRFNYSTPLGNEYGNYGGGGWDDFVDYYAKAKVVADVTTSTTTLFLSTTTGIIPGQVINFLNSSTLRVRTDTVVVSVDTSTRSIQISAPQYNIIRARSTATAIGSAMTIETLTEFYGDYRVGDRILISGITTSGYNGEYTIDAIYNNTMFGVTAYQVLGNTVANLTMATVRAYSILSPVYAQTKLLGNYSFNAGYCPVSTSTLTAGTFAISVAPDAYTWYFGTPYYSFGTIPSSINEGSVGTFNVVTANVTNGTTLYWTIGNVSTAAADFSASYGSFTVNNNTGSFTVSPTADTTTEGFETFVVYLRTLSTSGSIVSTSTSVTINDTSQGGGGGGGAAVAAFAGGTAFWNTFSYWSSNQMTAVPASYAEFQFNTNGTISVAYSSPAGPLYGYVDRYVNTFTNTGTNYDIKVDMRVGDGVQRSTAARTDYYVLGNFESPASGNSTGWVNLGTQRTIRVALSSGADPMDYVALATTVSIGPTGTATTSTSSVFTIDIGVI
jgi:hypothetical protein